MQIFIPYPDPGTIAKCLDKRRLNKQIIECRQIEKAINGAKAWHNHPVVLMYREYTDWLLWYREVLEKEQNGLLKESNIDYPDTLLKPPFIGYEPLHKAHRARLYAKDPIYYSQFIQDAGYTDTNWYIINNEIRKYKNGKLTERSPFTL
ncbi:MAG: pyrimidine dimer DNA glycosylase/endonuclease V [Bacteroidales bacterium]|nr:pyrimidine dimer DNA glycosylase/endonuclease V [Bacteroidales bacterium]